MQLITKSSTAELREHQTHSLNEVVSYCMSSTCRRKLILEYFDDETEVNCGGGCDNCLTTPTSPREFTTEAINACLCLEKMMTITPKINVKQLALTFKGSKSKRDVESKGFHMIPHYSIGKNVFKNDSDAIKFVQHLIINEVLTENLRAVDDKFITPFITLGKKSHLLRNREIKLFLRL
jgi:superfamily II DNA helicase RecQ